jgi:hypothetical protein
LKALQRASRLSLLGIPFKALDVKKGGQGGERTNASGLRFERQTSIAKALSEAGLQVIERELFIDGQLYASFLPQYALYDFLEEHGVDWRDHVSSKNKPDECLFIYHLNQFLIVEKKFQEVEGSVDIKLAAGHYLMRRYSKLASTIGASVKMIYLLSEFFQAPKYKDIIDYMQEMGIIVYFLELPLDEVLGNSTKSD